MSRIRILSEQLANQIAAGEVVERPASVIKELVENSLDAGATRIDIHVEGSGCGLLRIADNGCGMDGDDVLLCLERHATSKIRHEAQLANIATLGFRGEAIPSIASVSWLTILSRPQSQSLGTRATIRYGVLQETHQDGCAKGTVIEVRHLFGNMPARKKFLKSTRTELAHIEEVIRNQALAHPHTGFSLSLDGRVALAYQPEMALKQRVREVFRCQGPLLPLRLSESGDTTEISAPMSIEMALDGYLLLPETGASTAARLRLLVNKRPVQDAMLRHAVHEGLQGFLMKGTQAAGALLLDIAPDQVDINVHPAKREIRFRAAEAVHRFVAEQVRRAMREYQQSLRDGLFALPQMSHISQERDPQALLPSRSEFSNTPAAPARSTGDKHTQTGHLDADRPQQPHQPPLDVPTFATAEPMAHEAWPASWQQVPPQPAISASPQTPLQLGQYAVEPLLSGKHTSKHIGLTLIGQLFSLYLLCEKDGQLVVIDQHAAHERILYGQLLQGYMNAQIPQQALMFPVTVELSPSQMDTLEQKAATVAALGLTVAPFGEATYMITSVPALVKHIEASSLLRDVLDGLRGPLRTEASRPVPQAIDELLSSIACKAAIKAGKHLHPTEMLTLLTQMEASPIFSHCPHGRPVIKIFSNREVERWFYR